MKALKSILFLIHAFLFLQCEVPDPYGDLYVLIRDESGNLVQNCEVTIYSSNEDFINETNKIQESKTDENGRAFFLNLENKTYYVGAKYLDGDIEKNNLLVSTNVEVLVSEIGYRNSITVVIWNSFIGNMSDPDGKVWLYDKYIDVTSGIEQPVPECLQDDELIFYRNGNFEYISQEINCNEGTDDNFVGSYAPVSNGSFIIIKDATDQQRFGLYIVSATQSQMVAQYGSDFIYYKEK